MLMVGEKLGSRHWSSQWGRSVPGDLVHTRLNVLFLGPALEPTPHLESPAIRSLLEEFFASNSWPLIR